MDPSRKFILNGNQAAFHPALAMSRLPVSFAMQAFESMHKLTYQAWIKYGQTTTVDNMVVVEGMPIKATEVVVVEGM
jgi:hypothetical protein